MRVIVTTTTLLLAASGAMADVTTTWDSGTFEGWTHTPSALGGQWDLVPTGGNPDGYVSYIDGPSGSEPAVRLFAPSSYLGDYSAFGAGAGFRFDAIYEGTVNPPLNMPVIQLIGANGEIAEGFPPGVNDNTWQTVFIALEETSWTMISGNWSDLIQDVTALQLIGDNAIGAGVEAGVDNFALVVPTPSSLALLSLGGLVGLRRRR